MAGLVPWYFVHASQASAHWGDGDSEEIVLALFEELAAKDPDVGKVGKLAAQCASMPWNAHLVSIFRSHGLDVSSGKFPRGVDCGSLLAALSGAGVGANPMPFPLPRIEEGRVVTSQTVVTPSGRHLMSLLTTPTRVGYAFVRVIQRCIYGQVRRGIEVERLEDGRWRATGGQVAIKCIEHSTYDHHLRQHRGSLNEDPIKEVAVMQHVAGRGGAANVLGLVGVYAEEAAVYVVMPYCDQGDLFKYVEEHRALRERDAFSYFRQIVCAVHRLHELGLAHHDMSLENLLLDEHMNAVVIDFGMVVKACQTPRNFSHPPRGSPFGLREITKNQIPSGVDLKRLAYFAVPTQPANRWPARCGKLLYMAPEQYVQPRRPVDVFALDVWACGVILFLLLTGAPPWDPNVGPRDTDMRFVYVRDGRLRDLLDAWGISLPDLAVDCLMRLLDANPTTRITIPEIMQHAWWTAHTN